MECKVLEISTVKIMIFNGFVKTYDNIRCARTWKEYDFFGPARVFGLWILYKIRIMKALAKALC